MGYGSKLNRKESDRKFESWFPFTPFWDRIFDPQPFVGLDSNPNFETKDLDALVKMVGLGVAQKQKHGKGQAVGFSLW